MPFRPHRDVGVAPQAALFHVAVVDPERDEDLAKLPERLGGIARRAQIRLGDDLDQRRAAAIEIEVGLLVGVGEPLVERLARIFLHVHARDADAPWRRRRRRTRACRPSPAAVRIVRSDTPWADPGKSSFSGQKSTVRGPCSSSARAAFAAKSTARRFRTGRAPGKPRQTGQTLVFGACPNRVLQPQKIFVSVRSRACISSPMTGSNPTRCDAII